MVIIYSNTMEKIKSYFKQYPDEETVHSTSDGFLFKNPHDAEAHSRTCDDKKVNTYHKSDLKSDKGGAPTTTAGTTDPAATATSSTGKGGRKGKAAPATPDAGEAAEEADAGNADEVKADDQTGAAAKEGNAKTE